MPPKRPGRAAGRSGRQHEGLTVPDILVVCTANQCRSPMGEALLRRRLQQNWSQLVVESAGFITEGVAPPPDAVESMAEVGLDISGHRSRPLDEALIAGAGLVAVMTRDHLIEAATRFPAAWSRSFTVTELEERGGAAPRLAGEALHEWVRRLADGRTRSEVLAYPAAADIPDPIGRPRRDFDRVRDRLDRWATAFAQFLP